MWEKGKSRCCLLLPLSVKKGSGKIIKLKSPTCYYLQKQRRLWLRTHGQHRILFEHLYEGSIAGWYGPEKEKKVILKTPPHGKKSLNLFNLRSNTASYLSPWQAICSLSIKPYYKHRAFMSREHCCLFIWEMFIWSNSQSSLSFWTVGPH